MTTDPFQKHRDAVANSVLTAACGLSVLGALLSALGQPLVIGVGLAAVAAVIGAARWVARRLRERREDAADALVGAAWRAQHMPGLAAGIDADGGRDRVGVA
jgi:Flp pilus assembly protein TadB